MASVFRLQWIPIGALSHPGAKRTNPSICTEAAKHAEAQKIDAFNGFFSSLDSLGLSRNRKLCVLLRRICMHGRGEEEGRVPLFAPLPETEEEEIGKGEVGKRKEGKQLCTLPKKCGGSIGNDGKGGKGETRNKALRREFLSTDLFLRELFLE